VRTAGRTFGSDVYGEERRFVDEERRFSEGARRIVRGERRFSEGVRRFVGGEVRFSEGVRCFVRRERCFSEGASRFLGERCASLTEKRDASSTTQGASLTRRHA
jgi:hypothetical protein